MNSVKNTKSNKINDKMVILRLKRRLTQKQVAELASIDRAYYVKIENGRCVASVKTYKDIAVALGYSRWKNLIPDDI